MEIMTLRESQNRLLEMATVIHDILVDNNIPYMIAFGTLLGAVRHKGFIPWDDDFDIFLFGDSYEKAIEILRLNLPKDMFLEDSASEPLYFHAWAHIKDLHSVAVCEQFPQDGIYQHKGLSIDLYAAYEMDEAEVDLFRLKENLKYQQRKEKSGLLSSSELQCVTKKLEEKIKLEEYNKENWKGAKRPAYGIILNERIMYPEEIFPLKKYLFEGKEFYGPGNADSLLTRFYGDYMKLPDEDLRIPHYSVVERL